ncbi:MAG: thermonuclease family protein [Candidatus Omnitrophota bacterium]
MKSRILFLALFFLMFNILSVFAQSSSRKSRSLSEGFYPLSVCEIIDAETMKLSDGQVIKLIGIDTPEFEKSGKLYAEAKMAGIPVEVFEVMGNEAVMFVRSLVTDKKIRIELDEQEKNLYGVLLVYVFLLEPGEGEIFLNEKIIEQGYSRFIDTSPNLRFSNLFKKTFQLASQKATGLWKQWLR